MKKKALALSLTLLLGTGLSCDRTTGLPKTGGITLVLLSEAGEPLSIVAHENGSASAVSGRANILLNSVRVTASGPTNKTVTVSAPTGGFFNASVDGLLPGTYTVTVEGLVGADVAHFGSTTGVGVSAGASTPASITFPVFQPQLTAASVPDTSDLLHFTVTYPPVTGATGYIVRFGTSPTLTGATQVNVAGTTTEITVPNEGRYYLGVKAVNATVTGGGLTSSIVTVYAFQGVATVTITPATPSIAAGATVQLTAEARDADNAVVAGVSWFWASDNHTIARVSQTGLVTGVAGGTVTITAVGKGMPGGTALTVNQAAATLAFSIQPANAIAGEPLSPAVQVEIQDASGNRITTARDPVTIAFGANPGAGILSGTKTVNAVNGIASFSGISVNKAVGGYTLTATSGSLTGATSGTFAIAPAAPAKLTFGAQPLNALGNTVFGSAPTVTIADQFDNQTTATNNVTIALSGNPWKTPFATGGVLSGSLTVAAINGTATFSDLRLDKPAPGYSIAAAATGLVGATSNTFDINLTVQQISAATSGSHTCAVTTGGTYCWGVNSSGQLGAVTGQTSSDSIAALVRGGLTFTTVTTGGAHSCALTAAGAAYCWGAGSNGRLGNGGTANSDVPVPVSGSHAFESIDAGGSHTCAITTTAVGNPTEDRQVYCWGTNTSGQLGDGGVLGTPTFSATPVQVSEPLRTTTRATQISAGAGHTCVRAANNQAYCWGDNGQGQLGNNAVVPGTDLTTPTAVVGGFLWSSVTAGSNHSCGISTTQIARCWGYNAAGQIGDGGPVHTGVSAPQLVAGSITNWTGISAGALHTCGVAGGSAFCWGENNGGQLGDDNSPNDANQPVSVAGSLTFVAVTSGNEHSCGRTASATYCWGVNFSGRLGSPGTNAIKRVPTQIVQ